jgi:hypothetical protein
MTTASVTRSLSRLAGFAWLTSALVTASSTSFAADWRRLLVSQDGVVYEYDRDSMESPQAEIYRVWIKRDSTNATSKKPYTTSNDLLEFNCRDRTQRTVVTYYFGPDGNPLRTIPGERPHLPPPPDSIADVLLRLTCSPAPQPHKS